ncbi:hypothetical protein DMTZ50_0035 [Dehalococcoides mccartyi]|nr:hypothetical protein [Dehalococcoides mccartyi]
MLRYKGLVDKSGLSIAFGRLPAWVSNTHFRFACYVFLSILGVPTGQRADLKVQ